MPEPDPGAELHQPRLHRRHRRLDWDTQPPGGPPQQLPVPGRIGRAQLYQPPGLVRQGAQLAGEAVLDPVGPRGGARQAESAGQLGRAQPARHVQQRQRITAGLGHDQVGDPGVQRAGQRRGQQRPRIIVSEPPEVQLWQPG